MKYREAVLLYVYGDASHKEELYILLALQQNIAKGK